MKSSALNFGLLKNTIKRYWPLWIAFLAYGLFTILFPLLLAGPSMLEDEFSSLSLSQIIWSCTYVTAVVDAALASLLVVLFIFGYLYKSNTAIFYGMIPQKRSTLFNTLYFAGFAPLVFIELIISLGMLLECLFLNMSVAIAFNWFALSIICTFIFYSLAALCAQFSGSRLMTIALFMIALTFVPGVEIAIRLIATYMLNGIDALNSFYTLWASPIAGIVWYSVIGEGAILDGTTDITWLPLLWYSIFGIACFCFSRFFSKIRNLESCESAVAYKALRPIIKYIVSIGVALVLGLVMVLIVLVSTNNKTLICDILIIGSMVIGAFLGCLFTQMFLSKTTHVFKNTWKGALILSFVIVCAMCAIEGDVLGIEKYIPDTSKITSAQVVCESIDMTFTSNEGIEEVENIHKKLMNESSHSSTSITDEYATSYQIEIIYTLSDGDKIYRKYSVSEVVESPQYLSVLSSLLTSEEGLYSRFEKCWNCDDESLYVTISLNEKVGYDSVNLSDESSEFIEDESGSNSSFIDLNSQESEDICETALKADVSQKGFLENFDESQESSIGSVSFLCGDAYILVPLSYELTPNMIQWIENYTHESLN